MKIKHIDVWGIIILRAYMKRRDNFWRVGYILEYEGCRFISGYIVIFRGI